MFRADRFAEGRICLLGLEGSLSSTDLTNLAERLRGLAARGALRVVVDLRQVDHWDFRGLKCLSEAVAYRRRLGALTVFISPSAYLRSIAAAVGVLEDLDLYDDLRIQEESLAVPLAVVELETEGLELQQAAGL